MAGETANEDSMKISEELEAVTACLIGHFISVQTKKCLIVGTLKSASLDKDYGLLITVADETVGNRDVIVYLKDLVQITAKKVPLVLKKVDASSKENPSKVVIGTTQSSASQVDATPKVSTNEIGVTQSSAGQGQQVVGNTDTKVHGVTCSTNTVSQPPDGVTSDPSSTHMASHPTPILQIMQPAQTDTIQDVVPAQQWQNPAPQNNSPQDIVPFVNNPYSNAQQRQNPAPQNSSFQMGSVCYWQPTLGPLICYPGPGPFYYQMIPYVAVGQIYSPAPPAGGHSPSGGEIGSHVPPPQQPPQQQSYEPQHPSWNAGGQIIPYVPQQHPPASQNDGSSYRPSQQPRSWNDAGQIFPYVPQQQPQQPPASQNDGSSYRPSPHPGWHPRGR